MGAFSSSVHVGYHEQFVLEHQMVFDTHMVHGSCSAYESSNMEKLHNEEVIDFGFLFKILLDVTSIKGWLPRNYYEVKKLRLICYVSFFFLP